MKKWLALAVLICFISAFLSGCANAQTTPQETAVVTRGDLVISVSVSGNLEMPRKMDLSFGTTGTVAEIMANEGDEVSKGEVLAKLDARSLEWNVTTAQARYEAAQIGYEVAENNLMQTIYPYYTDTFATDLPGVWLSLDKAQNELAEVRKLLNEGKTEEVRKILEQLEGSLNKAGEKSQARVWALPLSVKLVELQTESAKSSLDIAKTELARANLELDKAMIVAPFDGVIADILVKEGQQLSSMTYTNPAISIVDPSEIKMSGVIDEIDVSKVKSGQEATIILDALPDKQVQGKVAFISPIGTVRAGVVSYKTTITLENPGEELKDGMSATAEIHIERRQDVLLIPNRAIHGTLEKPSVEVVTEKGTEQREITVGLSNGVSTEVLSGLREGERIVLPRVTQSPFLSFGG